MFFPNWVKFKVAPLFNFFLENIKFTILFIQSGQSVHALFIDGFQVTVDSSRTI